MPGGQRGMVRHFDSAARLSDEDLAFVRRTVERRGMGPSAKILRTSLAVIDRLLGPGTVQAATAARIAARVDELRGGSDG